MKHIIAGLCFFTVINLTSAFSQTTNEKTIVVEIHNVTINGGTLYVSASFNETAYKRQSPNITRRFEPAGNVIRAEITVPIGECVINVYQDLNGNGECDSGLFGIPKEPVGITNWDGKGPPGSYRRLKVEITNTTNTIRINLYQL
jgi:uncharacterized protein (DUF2141 family)